MDVGSKANQVTNQPTNQPANQPASQPFFDERKMERPSIARKRASGSSFLSHQ